MRFAVLVAFSLLCAFCLASFSEKVQVQVLDTASRAIEGASVYPVYQVDHKTGYVNGKERLTNKDGYVNISFNNIEFDTSLQDGNYTIVAKFGGQEARRSMEIDENRRWVAQLHVAAHYLNFLVVDQSGKPVFANVTVWNKTKETDGAGRAAFHLPDGSYEYSISGMDASKSGTVDVLADSTEQIVLQRYALKLSVSDENGLPLVASVIVGGKEYSTNQAGKLIVGNIGQQGIDVDVQYQGKHKIATVDLESEEETQIVLDGKPPIIRDFRQSVAGGAGHLEFTVVDEGVKAAGVSQEEGVYVSYVVNGAQGDASVFSAGYGRYEAEIAPQPENALVMYTVRATDREGNEATKEGSYTVPVSENKGQQPLSPAQNTQGAEGDNLMLFGAVIVIVVAAAAIIYVKKRMDAAKPPPINVA